ncbi:MAG TPA: hypothetical protein VH163_08675, partial [Gemmatimonadales bacterium]|nr:hypothetical protein [Gemmatimonadales bacterium]
ISLTLVNAGDFSATSLPNAFPVSGTVQIAGRGPRILIPGVAHDSLQILTLGGSPRVALVRSPAGAAFQDDTLAWVADSAFDSLVLVNVRSGQQVLARPVSGAPVAVAVLDSQVFAIHRTWLASVNVAGPPVPDSIPLSGSDAHFAVIGDDSLLYVISRGDSGHANGRLSVVDPASRSEVVVINGLGERPGPGVFHPTGRILIASSTDGILEVNTLTRSVTRGPGFGIKPGGKGVVALALDARGRIYAVSNTGCGSAGILYVLSPPPGYNVITTVSLGLCPVASTVAEMPAQ